MRDCRTHSLSGYKESCLFKAAEKVHCVSVFLFWKSKVVHKWDAEHYDSNVSWVLVSVLVNVRMFELLAIKDLE